MYHSDRYSYGGQVGRNRTTLRRSRDINQTNNKPKHTSNKLA